MTEAVDMSTGELVAQPVTGLAQYEGAGGLDAAKAIADKLDAFITDRDLVVTIGKGKHIRVEAWCALGTMMGVAPRTAWTRSCEIMGQSGFEARVEVVRIGTGDVIGAAEAGCFSGESQSRWIDGNKQDVPRWDDLHAMMSMAQTRATSKALGQVLRWIPELAGYSGTPAEEMPAEFGPAGTSEAAEPEAAIAIVKDVFPEAVEVPNADAAKQAQDAVFSSPTPDLRPKAAAGEYTSQQLAAAHPRAVAKDPATSAARSRQISAPQAGRAIAIAISAAEPYKARGFEVLGHILKDMGLEPFPGEMGKGEAKAFLQTQLQWGQQYEAFCAKCEKWTPAAVSDDVGF